MTQLNDLQSPMRVCAAVIHHQNKILITLRPQNKKLGGYWEFPGGKIENQESPEAALKRELREELDIDVEVGELLETVRHSYSWGNVVIFAYWCHWMDGDIKHLEVADHCWVAADKLLDYDILAADYPIIKKIQEQLS